MDDLLDAIQDAEYIGAMCNPAPMPTEPLRLVSDEEAVAFGQRLRAANPEALTFETILSESLGYYLVRVLCCVITLLRRDVVRGLRSCVRSQFKQHLESLGSHVMLQFVEAALAFSVRQLLRNTAHYHNASMHIEIPARVCALRLCPCLTSG